LIRVEGIIQLLIYILPEFIVLICAWTEQFYEILLGVHEKREIETEDIEDARNRFVRLISNNLSNFSIVGPIQYPSKQD
jgi:hypothetical protein